MFLILHYVLILNTDVVALLALILVPFVQSALLGVESCPKFCVPSQGFKSPCVRTAICSASHLSLPLKQHEIKIDSNALLQALIQKATALLIRAQVSEYLRNLCI